MSPFRVVVVGLGGLGTQATLALLRHLTSPLSLLLVDGDVVEESNLNRQFLFTEGDIGKSKATIFRDRLAPFITRVDVQLRIVAENLVPHNAEQLLGDADYVIDATDNVETKFLINDLCVAFGKAFVYAGVLGEYGQLLRVVPNRGGGCLRCLFGEVSRLERQSCRTAGVLGAITGIFGALQAESACRFTEREAPSTSSLVRLAATEFHTTPVPAALDCPLGCGSTTVKVLNLTDKRCPETFLYAKVALESLPVNSLLELQLATAEAAWEVRSSLAEHGITQTRRPFPFGATGWRLEVLKPLRPWNC